ncbi:fructosamine kinase family protein [Nocardioides rubriscoriae]|uniref:fructosamine kinase family protein n=1 Tax=Nocardioides rubriscoriae TaxID=642762 RepID=UPI0011DF9317|nr:fructosamine kinase family protein [Nocardioides rubriscoriae]
MTRQPAIARRAEQLLGTAVVATAPVAGGDVSIATKLRLGNGTTALMKTMTRTPPGFFEQEAWGLRWLAEATADGGVPVPEVLAVEPDCLVLGWVETGRPTGDEAAALGRSLAITHATGAPSYGARRDGFIGRLPLPQRPTDTWAEFLAERRLRPFVRLAHDRGAIEPEDAAAVEAVAARLGELVPEEPPARLHGDLWNGNVLWGADGRAAVIDPAAHGGHREVDLAMLSLFGLPHLQRLLDAYAEVAPLADGWEDRVGLFQIFPLLVHACLFGGGYGARAAAVARRYR